MDCLKADSGTISGLPYLAFFQLYGAKAWSSQCFVSVELSKLRALRKQTETNKIFPHTHLMTGISEIMEIMFKCSHAKQS